MINISKVEINPVGGIQAKTFEEYIEQVHSKYDPMDGIDKEETNTIRINGALELFIRNVARQLNVHDNMTRFRTDLLRWGLYCFYEIEEVDRFKLDMVMDNFSKLSDGIGIQIRSSINQLNDYHGMGFEYNKALKANYNTSLQTKKVKSYKDNWVDSDITELVYLGFEGKNETKNVKEFLIFVGLCHCDIIKNTKTYQNIQNIVGVTIKALQELLDSTEFV